MTRIVSALSPDKEVDLMKIHTNTVLYLDVLQAVNSASPGTFLDHCDLKGSRTHKHAFDVALESDGTPDKKGKARRRKRNMGTSRYADRFNSGFAASYDDWGWFLAALFAKDPDIVAGPYKGAEDFHRQTNNDYLVEVTA